MSEEIQVGDLVFVVRPPECCKNPAPLGGPYPVLAVRTPALGGTCAYCRQVSFPASKFMECQIQLRGLKGWVERYRLRKLKPPGELGVTDAEVADLNRSSHPVDTLPKGAFE